MSARDDWTWPIDRKDHEMMCDEIDKLRAEVEVMRAWFSISRETLWNGTSYTCPRCGAVTWNKNDLANKYCGKCHRFESDSDTAPDVD